MSTTKRKPTPVKAWAVMIYTSRGHPWINHHTIAYTKREAWRRYLELWNPDHRCRAEAERRKGLLEVIKVVVSARVD